MASFLNHLHKNPLLAASLEAAAPWPFPDPPLFSAPEIVLALFVPASECDEYVLCVAGVRM